MLFLIQPALVMLGGRRGMVKHNAENAGIYLGNPNLASIKYKYRNYTKRGEEKYNRVKSNRKAF